jgi:uncharacterized membrane protein YfcA
VALPSQDRGTSTTPCAIVAARRVRAFNDRVFAPAMIDFSVPHAAITLAVGLVAGLVGGLAGIGGSIIMLPALGLLFGYSGADKNEQHLYIAAAMLTNIVVAWSSHQHHKAKGVTRVSIVRVVLPAMLVGVVGGVGLGTVFEGRVAKHALIGFILLYSVFCLVTAFRTLPDPPEDHEHPRPLLAGIGGLTGVAAGFLGIGGGILLVPLLQGVARVPLRQAIAASAAVMWITAALGATLKLTTLPSKGLSVWAALGLASLMAIGATVGARAGAWLTHRLSLPWLKAVIGVLLGVAAVRLAMKG